MKIQSCIRALTFVFLTSALSSCVAIDYMSGEAEAKRIRKVGTNANAQIIEIFDTGMTLNNDPIVGFKLHVRPPGAESYEAQTQGLVSRLHIPQIQPGAVIPVVIDPDDRSKVAINIYEEIK